LTIGVNGLALVELTEVVEGSFLLLVEGFEPLHKAVAGNQVYIPSLLVPKASTKCREERECFKI
jgi:hypothetical protein